MNDKDFQLCDLLGAVFGGFYPADVDVAPVTMADSIIMYFDAMNALARLSPIGSAHRECIRRLIVAAYHYGRTAQEVRHTLRGGK